MSKHWFEDGYEPEERDTIVCNDLQRIFDHAKEYGYDPKEIVVGEGMAKEARRAAEELGITIPIRVAHPPKLWSIEEYKAQPFKYDGECKPVPISEIWNDIPRRNRREIERLVKKGKNPDIMDYI